MRKMQGLQHQKLPAATVVRRLHLCAKSACFGLLIRHISDVIKGNSNLSFSQRKTSMEATPEAVRPHASFLKQVEAENLAVFPLQQVLKRLPGDICHGRLSQSGCAHGANGHERRGAEKFDHLAMRLLRNMHDPVPQ